MRKTALIAVLLGFLMSTRELAAQQPGQRGAQDSGGREMMMNMQQHMRMMDSTTAVLDSLAGRMNRATGNAKVSAIAQIINALVSERKAMQTHMRQMMESHGKMMRGHMMPGGDSGRAEPGDTSAHQGHHPTQ